MVRILEKSLMSKVRGQTIQDDSNYVASYFSMVSGKMEGKHKFEGLISQMSPSATGAFTLQCLSHIIYKNCEISNETSPWYYAESRHFMSQSPPPLAASSNLKGSDYAPGKGLSVFQMYQQFKAFEQIRRNSLTFIYFT